MKKILGDAKSVRQLLKGNKYSVDYYQREYKWEAKQLAELVADLTGKFLESYEAGHERSSMVTISLDPSLSARRRGNGSLSTGSSA